MESDKVDSHSEKIAEGNSGNQSSATKTSVSQQDGDNKEEVGQQNE